MTWDEATKDRLRRFWSEGHSAKEIARQDEMFKKRDNRQGAQDSDCRRGPVLSDRRKEPALVHARHGPRRSELRYFSCASHPTFRWPRSLPSSGRLLTDLKCRNHPPSGNMQTGHWVCIGRMAFSAPHKDRQCIAAVVGS